jgi:hypothetical protein
MRFASSFGRLARELCALVAACCSVGCVGCVGCAAPHAATGDAGVEQRPDRPDTAARSGAAQTGGAPSRTPGSAGADAQQGRRSGTRAPSYIGDVPARAASSGNRPCGSSEFSTGPCGERPAAAPDAGAADGGKAPEHPTDCRVSAVPDAVRASYQLDAFYKQYASAHGIPVLGSDAPDPRSLQLACQLVQEMISERADVRDALIASKVTFAIVATAERTTEIPEYRDLPREYDVRARGLGGHTGLCAEESILCDRDNDPWRGESICVHEYAHTIAIYGLFAADSSFEDRLADAFQYAREAGLWRDTFAGQDAQEYWAEGAQDWYETNLEADPADGVHGPIDTQRELLQYDPLLYHLLDELLPKETLWPDCYRKRR